MSRIGNKPVALPNGVTVTVNDDQLVVKGPKGQLQQKIAGGIAFDVQSDVVNVNRENDSKPFRANHGLMRALLNNMVIGVSDGYERALDLIGTGYRVQQNGKGLTFQLVFSHPVEVQPLEGITLEADGQVRVVVKGADKQAVGHQAAVIRKLRPPNAYTGKGVRYDGEQIHLKPGKSAARAE